jgi:nucleoside phosphorylase
VILTVIPAELEAARRVLQIADDDRDKDEDGTIYLGGSVHSAIAGRVYSIALACIGSAGNPGAAAATTHAIRTYRPRAVLLMGIAAGLRGKIKIGHVVLSERVVAYEPAALVRSDNGTVEQPRPEIDRAPHIMMQDVIHYRGDAERLRAAFERAGGVIPAATTEQVDEFRAHVADAITSRLATIASGEKLLRDPSKLLAVRTLHGKVDIGEMEAAGVVEACRRASVPWLVIRGISDFGDELKGDRFHAFASCAAAAVLHDFLAHGSTSAELVVKGRGSIGIRSSPRRAGSAWR